MFRGSVSAGNDVFFFSGWLIFHSENKGCWSWGALHTSQSYFFPELLSPCLSVVRSLSRGAENNNNERWKAQQQQQQQSEWTRFDKPGRRRGGVSVVGMHGQSMNIMSIINNIIIVLSCTASAGAAAVSVNTEVLLLLQERGEGRGGAQKASLSPPSSALLLLLIVVVDWW